jgi:hypothetical protein
MDMYHKNHLVTHVVAYESMKSTNILYVQYVDCMQLDVTRDLFYATKAKISCMCCVQLKINYNW